jgi:hypothetical protein
MYDTALYQYLLTRIASMRVSGTTRILRDQLGRRVGIVGTSGHAEAASQSAQGCASIGVYGKAAANGHRSLTRICDWDEDMVEPIAEDRAPGSLKGYDAGLTQEQLNGIEAVAMDM